MIAVILPNWLLWVIAAAFVVRAALSAIEIRQSAKNRRLLREASEQLDYEIALSKIRGRK